ncbi:MAG TPA: M23 family metallopeptidase [Cyclobacteriaceae bacterium]|nr:M23 family metallopeptidase [Cyclobacteriaceae bacterium]HMV09847.1 M23 family metallopeptidase [Cyclobacteriaceae bacterium]HMV91264.1 M23 family metallopeptidase [Cyclobacteriaceae bacterium]HMX00444.1 M23 family metallopeptidase [Cyclobacteriaceae bacterium]HMX50472.1 M23 family metallopeptidase [Cyclobacteriaceae bacterium]
MKLSKLAACVSILIAHTASGQFSETDSATSATPREQERYIFPIRPGSTGSLAGTMGELRSTHFHSGIDIRTNNEIGWPVLAAKSGYISRAGVSPVGYGNVLYITHPDGNTTVYGHLDKFKGAVGDYVLKERYRRKQSSIDLEFSPNIFPVKQGDTIAYAGNTGSSGGPHLHFNIQREDMALDPLNFNFNEIRDAAPPVVQKIALKTLDINSRVNDRFGRFEFYASRIGSNYSLNTPILASGTIGIEVLGFDRVDNARYRCGINYIEVYLDSVRIFSQKIEELDLNDPRGIYGLIDYKAHRSYGNRFYKLYIDDGNRLGFYSTSPGNGQIRVDSTKTSNIRIVLKDIYGNTSQVNLKLKPVPVVKEVRLLEPATVPAAYDIQENTLSITTKTCPDIPARAYVNGAETLVKPDYFSAGKSVYLFDLRKQIPDSVKVCDQTLIPNIKATVPAGVDFKYYSERIDVQLPKASLFDTLYLNASYTIRPDSSEVFTVGNPFVPLNRPVTVSLKPLTKFSTDRKTGVYRMIGKGYGYEGGKWLNGSISFTTREFGNFVILEDNIPPTIQTIYINNQAARFKIKDALSGINSFEATLNGKWLLMTYDAKSNTIMSEKLNKHELLKGDFVLTVTDNAGNKKILKHRIP